MELRQYLAVVWRRWPIIVLVVVLAALGSFGLAVRTHPVYTTATRLAMRQFALPSVPPGAGQPGFYTFDNYYNWYSTEFLADDYTLIVPSQAFAARVKAQLAPAYQAVSAGEIQGSLSADRTHRELHVVVTADDPQKAVAIAQGVDAVLTSLSTPAGTTPSTTGVAIHDNALFAVIDPPSGAASNRSRQLTNAAIACLVALALGLGLAFLIEYLDNSLRDPADAEQVIGLPVLGAIPAGR